MNRSHFLPVFLKAWKKAINMPQNIVSGFRKCGLVPLNPSVIDFDKLIPSTPPLFNKQKAVDQNETIGMIRMYQLFESLLPEPMKNCFTESFENDYNIVDQTDNGILYQYFKKGQMMIEDSKKVGTEVGTAVQRNVELNDSHNVDHSEHINDPATPVMAIDAITPDADSSLRNSPILFSPRPNENPPETRKLEMAAAIPGPSGIHDMSIARTRPSDSSPTHLPTSSSNISLPSNLQKKYAILITMICHHGKVI